MAEAGGPDGHVDTIEGVEEHADLAKAEMASRGLSGQVTVIKGRALDVLPTLRQPYDGHIPRRRLVGVSGHAT